MLRDVSDLRWHGRHRSDCHLVRFSATPLTDRLRALWDFDDLGASEQRFQAQLERETTDPGRAERGRMFRSSGDPEAAFPLFQDAFARAVEAGEHFLAGDAA